MDSTTQATPEHHPAARLRHRVVHIGVLALMAISAPLGLVACNKTEAPRAAGGWAVAQIDEQANKAAAFAVEQQATRAQALLKLVELTQVSTQVVAGMNYELTMRLQRDGSEQTAKAVVWLKLDGSMELTSWTWL